MSKDATAASVWRIELARELIRYYVPHEGIEMAILSGSPPKGLSDEFSDLDILIFWSRIDAEWLEADPLRNVDCERKYFRRMGDGDLYLEGHYFGPLKVDIGHGTIGFWKQEVEDVVERHEADPSKLGAMAGFLTALPLYGDDVVEEWKAKVRAYPDELRDKVVRMHRRFFVPGYLLNQAYHRGDVLAYYDGLCTMLKNLLNILAGLNRVYLSTEEPRWLGYYLDLMEHKPPRTLERLNAVIGGPAEAAVAELESLMSDVLDLLDEHMPELESGAYRERWRSMAVTGCAEKPEVRQTG